MFLKTSYCIAVQKKCELTIKTASFFFYEKCDKLETPHVCFKWALRMFYCCVQSPTQSLEYNTHREKNCRPGEPSAAELKSTTAISGSNFL